MRAPVAIETRMTEYPMLATADMSISRALTLMDEFRIRHLPVVAGRDSGRIVGVVSERDLLRVEPFIDSMSMVVGDIMIANPYVAAVGTPLVDATRVMTTEKYGCVVVVDGAGLVKGIFTTTDALRMLTELLEAEDESERPNFRDWTVEDYFEWDAGMGE